MNHSLVLALSLSLLTGLPAQARPRPLPAGATRFSASLTLTPPTPVQRIDSLMRAAHTRGVFNGNLLVAHHGQVIYHKAWGYADAGRTRQLDTTLLFDIGSIAKEFNGVGIMQLKEQGRLRLDDPVAAYMPELPTWARRVRIRHLLTYTSGLPNFTAQSEETDEQLRAYLQGLDTLRYPPGTAYTYAHANVYLQRRIIERITGLSYADYIDKAIFRPCRMSRSVMDADLGRDDVARAFDNAFQPTPYLQRATGSPRLSARDLYRFITQLEAYQLISHASFDTLAASFPGGESSLGTTGITNGHLQWHRHQGSNSNYEALVYTDQVAGVRLVMQTNNQNFKVDALKTALLHILNDEPYTVPKRSLYLAIRDRILADRAAGLAFYEAIKATQADQYDLSSEASDLISTGKYLQRRSRFEDAIAVYTLAAPLCRRANDTSYAYELVGECYLKKGDKPQAIAFYQKALMANPANQNAMGVLQTLHP